MTFGSKRRWMPTLLLIALAALSTLEAPNADYRFALQSPSLRHFLGTDPSGADILRICAASTGHMIIEALVAVLLTTAIGILVAAVMANVTHFFIDRFFLSLAFFLDALGPLLPLAALFAVAPHIPKVGMTVGVAMLTWPTIAIPLRTEIIAAARQDYVMAAIVLGVTKRVILWHHILPHVTVRLLPQCLALLTNLIGLFAALQFIGVSQGGSRPLGFIIYESATIARQCPWYFASATASLILALVLIRWLTLSIRFGYTRNSE